MSAPFGSPRNPMTIRDDAPSGSKTSKRHPPQPTAQLDAGPTGTWCWMSFKDRRLAAAPWKVLDFKAPWVVKFLHPRDECRSRSQLPGGGEMSYSLVLSDCRKCWWTTSDSSSAKREAEEFNPTLCKSVAPNQLLSILSRILTVENVSLDIAIEILPEVDDCKHPSGINHRRVPVQRTDVAPLAETSTARPNDQEDDADRIGTPGRPARGLSTEDAHGGGETADSAVERNLAVQYNFGGIVPLRWRFSLKRMRPFDAEENFLRTTLLSPILLLVPALQSAIDREHDAATIRGEDASSDMPTVDMVANRGSSSAAFKVPSTPGLSQDPAASGEAAVAMSCWGPSQTLSESARRAVAVDVSTAEEAMSSVGTVTQGSASRQAIVVTTSSALPLSWKKLAARSHSSSGVLIGGAQNPMPPLKLEKRSQQISQIFRFTCPGAAKGDTHATSLSSASKKDGKAPPPMGMSDLSRFLVAAASLDLSTYPESPPQQPSDSQAASSSASRRRGCESRRALEGGIPVEDLRLIAELSVCPGASRSTHDLTTTSAVRQTPSRSGGVLSRPGTSSALDDAPQLSDEYEEPGNVASRQASQQQQKIVVSAARRKKGRGARMLAGSSASHQVETDVVDEARASSLRRGQQSTRGAGSASQVVPTVASQKTQEEPLGADENAAASSGGRTRPARRVSQAKGTKKGFKLI